jgi:hypothetical protein
MKSQEVRKYLGIPGILLINSNALEENRVFSELF